jgi:hypothetical protein
MMEAVKENRTPVPQNSTNKYIFFGIFISFLIILALYINNFSRAVQGASLPQGTVVISQGTLAEKYGLRVNLVAVTAAGGMVDVRLKIVDGEKLKALLADKGNFPALLTEQGVVLNAPEDTKSQEIQFITGGNLFIMYPNSGNSIKQDSPVTILFGNIAVEPVNAR